MASLGIAAAIYAIAVSGLSDHHRAQTGDGVAAVPLGRRPARRAVLISNGSSRVVHGRSIPLFFVGWAVNGIFPIFMATIPSETFSARHHATVLGLAMGSCEVLGGVFGPPAAG